MTLALGISLLGGVGAMLRYVVDTLVSMKVGRSIPWGTMLVNVIGSAFAGLILGATTYQTVSPTTSALLLTGFLGGFTTASTLAFEGARLVQARRLSMAILVLVGTMVTSMLVATLGLVIGRA